MREFQAGAFVLARRAGVPVVPVRIHGAGRAWRPGTLVVSGSHEIRIRVLDPVSAQEVAAAEVDGLCRRVRETIANA
jgi:1-acyl-sn-glycerol-3-phosphate acyltransferase